MENKARIVGLLVASLLPALSQNNAVAEIYQWTDSGGTLHFSDSPVSGSKKTLKVIPQDDDGAAAPARNREASEDANGPKTGKLRPKNDPAVEAEIREVWRRHREAIARNDAVSAAGFISHEERYECVRTYTQLGKHLPKMADYMKDLTSIQVYDGWAKCIMLRDEMAAGRMVTLGFDIYFVKQDGIWKVRDCK